MLRSPHPRPGPAVLAPLSFRGLGFMSSFSLAPLIKNFLLGSLPPSPNIPPQSTSFSAVPAASWGPSSQVTPLLKTFCGSCPQTRVTLTIKMCEALSPDLRSGFSLPSCPARSLPSSLLFRLYLLSLSREGPSPHLNPTDQSSRSTSKSP